MKRAKNETLINSDQGCHYSSYNFIKITQNHNLRRSISRRGNCWDNLHNKLSLEYKNEIGEKIKLCKQFDEIKLIIDDWKLLQ